MSVTAGRLAEVSGDSLGVEFFSRATKDVELGATFDLSPGELGVFVVLGNTRSAPCRKVLWVLLQFSFLHFRG